MKQLQQFNVNMFVNDLLSWYRENKRDLPWRKTDDPYRIWVSEIMLQQTQVATVIPYYEQFLQKFPTVFDLAEADEQIVLKQWEGLGYYSRARYLHEAAKEVVNKHAGIIPNDKKEISKLKGIGPYTCGAIMSIAFNKPEPAVDGNVMRVLSRILLIDDNIAEAKTRKKFEKIVDKLISKDDPSSFNQGLMELGALICTPKSPLCLHCPVRDHCQAFQANVQTELPVKTRAKRPRIEPYIVVIIKNEDNSLLIEQRPNEGLLANMWQFPMVKVSEIGINEIERWVNDTYNISTRLGKCLGDVKHIFSHKVWELTIYEMSVCSKRNEQCVNMNELQSTMIKENKNHNTYTSLSENRHARFESLSNLASYPFSVSHLKIRQLI